MKVIITLVCFYFDEEVYYMYHCPLLVGSL